MISIRPIDPLLDRVARTLSAGGRVWLVGAPEFLQQGEVATVLPPAPHPRTGWDNGPYVRSWSEQLAFVLQSRAGNIREIPVESPGRVNPLEDLSLMVVTGWRGGRQTELQ
jgi:hypothetical protein